MPVHSDPVTRMSSELVRAYDSSVGRATTDWCPSGVLGVRR